MKKSPAELDHEKQVAAAAAVEFVKGGMNVGLGTGSTSAHFIRALAKKLNAAGETVTAVSTSEASVKLATELGIKIVPPTRGLRLDVAVDGADEIGPKLALTKGGGGALLREKVVAANADTFIVIADSDKPRAHLGAFPLPLEVIPYAAAWVMDAVDKLGGNPKLREKEGQLVLSDQKNYLVDCSFGVIQDPEELAAELVLIPGIAEHGLFLGLAKFALVGNGDSVTRLDPDWDGPGA